MKQHSFRGEKNCEKDQQFDVNDVVVSQHSLGFIHGFVFCLVLKNILRHIEKEEKLSYNVNFDNSIDTIASSRLACVLDQSSEECTDIKQEASDILQTREQAVLLGFNVNSLKLSATTCQKFQTITTETENKISVEKNSPVSSLSLQFIGDESGSDTHNEEQLTDTSEYLPNYLHNVQDDHPSLDFVQCKQRKRKQGKVVGVKKTKKRQQVRQSRGAQKSASRVISKTKLKLAQKTSSIFTQNCKISCPKNLKTCSGNTNLDTNRKLTAVSGTTDCSEPVVDDTGVMDTAVSLTSQLYACDKCGKTFTTARSYKRHAIKGHLRTVENINKQCSEKIFHAQCDKCPKVYTGGRAEKNLHQHILAYHSEMNPVQCDVCNATLNNEHHLKLHKRGSHRKDVCYICGAHFVTQIGLQTHLLAHKGDKSFICEICGAAFARVSSLRQHTKFHTESRDFKCGQCPLSFKTFSSLSIHMMCVHQCGSYFSSQVQKLAELGYVIDQDSMQRLQTFKCVTCGQELVNSACPLHSTDCMLSFSCPQCQWTTKDIQKFRKHLVKRNSATVCSGTEETKNAKNCGGLTNKNKPLVKNFVCASCGKQFYTQSHLQAHRHQHAEKRFSCPICNKSFTYKFNMQNHLTTHTDARPFECQICQKTFKMKSQLQLHRRYHDGEFKCEICGKILTRKQHVVNHYKLVHPETQMPK